ncbi:DNA-processing protein DprA [Micromonospora sp. NBC_01796]|uniref:DNA-processing protein DprA n=1 Tax=Micromonospora sp. NBC_01796 TaxID=2975987 RepID=UPI002DD8C03B|nr:DNA-processing protein DprA [Micromonospora sp. NBC_01796]WSA82774.1 DNA-protecting protein DprA [Micromonospora sp. NBC_01796]
MPDDREAQVAALVALLRQPGARWTEIATDVLAEGNALTALHRRLGAEATLFADDPARDALDAALAELQEWAANGIAVHSLFDDTYPARLRDIHQMPPIIFTRGAVADDRWAVAVVGTRKPSEHGVSIAESCATALAESGITVVSGLAAGIDTAAHTAALRAGGRTVAVIGTGVNRYYPATNKTLQDRIVKNGLVLSQFWPDAPPGKHTFPMRNAVMSGYAAATVVVEAAYRSGARMQARLALEHGRPVVLADSLLEHDWAREYAKRPGVYVVSNANELVTTVNQLVREIPDSPQALEGLPRLELL